MDVGAILSVKDPKQEKVTLDEKNIPYLTPRTVSPERTRKSVAQFTADRFLGWITVIFCHDGVVGHARCYTLTVSVAT